MPRSLLLLFVLLAAESALARDRVLRSGTAEDPRTWLRQHGIALTADHRYLPLFAHATVIALGDATHGTHELFATKVAIIQALVEHGGYDVIAFEAPYGFASESLQSTDYFFWDTEEVLELVEWARERNVEIAGLDSVTPHPVIDHILASAPIDLRAEIEERYACLAAHAASPWSYGLLTPINREGCRAKVASVRPMLIERGASEELVHAGRVVEQGEETLTTGMATREAAIAENVVWVGSAAGARSSSGDTTSISAGGCITSTAPPGTKSAGAFLHETLGNRYLAIASTVYAGTFWAMDVSGVIREQTMPAPTPDDIATLLRTAATSPMLVSLRGSLPQGLATPRPIRIAGSNVASPQRTMVTFTEDLPARFDAIVYVETSTPTKLRHFPTR